MVLSMEQKTKQKKQLILQLSSEGLKALKIAELLVILILVFTDL
jgi:hypothetical protein